MTSSQEQDSISDRLLWSKNNEIDSICSWVSLSAEDCLFWTYNILILLVMSKSKDMEVLARDKKTLAEDSLLPLHCGSASNCRAESRADYPPHSRVQHPTVAYFQPKTLSLVSPLVRNDTSPVFTVTQWHFLIMLHLSYTGRCYTCYTTFA